MSNNVAETSDKSFTNRLLTLVAVLVAVANIAIYAVVYQASWNEFGTASPVVLDDIDTGVYRLSVKSVPDVPWNSTEPHVETSDYDGELTEDQVTAHRDGWDASCISLARLDLIDETDVLSCMTSPARPTHRVPGPAHGASAGLAEALAAFSTQVDILGDLKIAATGALRITMWEDSLGDTALVAEVQSIGGVAEKVDAAYTAGVDVLVVPVANTDEFTSHMTPGGPHLVTAATVHGAVVELCALSQTEACATLNWE